MHRQPSDLIGNITDGWLYVELLFTDMFGIGPDGLLLDYIGFNHWLRKFPVNELVNMPHPWSALIWCTTGPSIKTPLGILHNPKERPYIARILGCNSIQPPIPAWKMWLASRCVILQHHAQSHLNTTSFSHSVVQPGMLRLRNGASWLYPLNASIPDYQSASGRSHDILLYFTNRKNMTPYHRFLASITSVIRIVFVVVLDSKSHTLLEEVYPF